MEAGVRKTCFCHEWYLGNKAVVERCRAAFKAGWVAALEAEHAAGAAYVGREIFRATDGPDHRARVVGHVQGHLVVRYPGCMLFMLPEADFRAHWRFFGP